MAITDWPEGDRPREKLLQRGAAALSDAELLAIFLRTGVKGKSAVDLAREMLTQFGSLTKLIAVSQKEFCQIHGMGQAKYVQLQATVELARRALQEEMRGGDVLNSPGAVRDYLRLLLGGRTQEVFMVIFLDAQHRALASEEMFHGTLTQTSVYPREVVKRALHHNAAAVIFAHNRYYARRALQPQGSNSKLSRSCPHRCPQTNRLPSRRGDVHFSFTGRVRPMTG